MNGPVRRKLAVGLSAAALGLGALAPVGTLLAPASAAGAASVEASAVTSGNARFEVLSPTLIRMEYAGDGTFEDAATFNAIGRDGFTPVSFTHDVVDGWLRIETGQATLRYKVGSGMFTKDNISLQVKTGAQSVTAHPAFSTIECAVGALCEAESAALTGLSTATDHRGYTGTGFVAGYEKVGNALSFTTTVGQGGSYDLGLRYANSQGGDGQTRTRTLSVVVDGQPPATLSLPAGSNWDEWKTAFVPLGLTPGAHTITVTRAASNDGQVNVDSLAVVPSGAGYPASPSAATAQDCSFGTVCEAESAGKSGNATTATDHNGYSGSGFAAGLWGGAGSALTAHVTDVPADGDYTLQVRYANGLAASPKLTLAVDGRETTGTLPPTSGWDYWNTVSVPVHLAAGTNDVKLNCPTESNNCNVNIDTLAAVATGTAALAAHAPLGGYRRDLDKANGTMRTYPGLLYQDGWSLLDDTASARYDTTTRSVTPRGSHGGTSYFDGYLFAYGHDYTTALRDLAELTGPTKLLPRWAYGVWYSEYYDRTQQEFESIAEQFKEHGVPVDVMAIDTDYKAGSKWNGWEVDASRIQSLQTLLATWHALGIHNTLNVHPTISATDPKFPAAQATAQGALTKSGDNYLFDWSDPKQLQAYLDLHDSIQQDGVDNWWLDWCCSENSKYSENGVTPDAFINQQYADYTNEALDGRGFSLSRAYGSLTAGGYGNPQPVATGPWADKRTTLHFTGDTTSTWDMLKAEVGYTPGESAATGLAAISHDIGGHNGGQYNITGAEPGTTQLPEDLYVRWLQFGAFQPIDRLHSNHSDRLPWQYPAGAEESATRFLKLRESLVPLTYTLAAQATATGTPIVRPLYLQYPEAPESYALAGSEYLYGPDVLVAPVTSGGPTATTSVWFPEGSTWTDWFTGKTYAGGTTADVTTDWDSMPVFIRSGGIVTTRTQDVANDDQGPLDAATATVAEGADGSGSLYEDDGKTADLSTGATTGLAYHRDAATDVRTLDVAATRGTYAGQVTKRTWTVVFHGAQKPVSVWIDNAPAGSDQWSWAAEARTVTVTAPERSVHQALTVSYSPTAAPAPGDRALTSTAPPSLSGRAATGSTLTVSSGSWSASPSSYSYQWLRDGRVVPGATRSSYTATLADLGHHLSATVTASLEGYASGSATSPAVTVWKGSFALARMPMVLGKVKVGMKVRAWVGSWSPRPASYSYQWLRNGKAIRGATKATYKVSRADRHRKLSVRVTAKRPGYVKAKASSRAVRVR